MEIVEGECIHAFPMHIHESFCVGLITSGRAELIKKNQKTMLSVGEGYFIPPYTPHALSAVAFEKFSYVVFCFKHVYAQIEINDIAMRAKMYIEASEKLCIDSLAEAVHVSKYHLNRVFKAQIGVTPYQFYMSKKIKKIRQGVKLHYPLSDLAFDLGFFDQSHLCNVFKKHMGITPMRYVRSYMYLK